MLGKRWRCCYGIEYTKGEFDFLSLELKEAEKDLLLLKKAHNTVHLRLNRMGLFEDKIKCG